jgi:hypothetical protein
MNLFDYGLNFDYTDTRITWDLRYKEFGWTWLSIFCGSKIITSIPIQCPEPWEHDRPLPYFAKRWEKCN